MQITQASQNQTFKGECDLLVIPLLSGKIPKLAGKQSEPLYQEILRHAKLDDLSSENGASLFFFPGTEGTKPKRVVLLNIKHYNPGPINFQQTFFRISGSLSKISSCGVLVPKEIGEQFVTEFILNAYKSVYTHPKVGSVSEKNKEDLRITFYTDLNAAKIITRAVSIAQSIELVKKLSDTPANLLTPKSLAEEARKLAKKHGLRAEILGEKEMSKLSMGGILSVSRGSEEEAQLITLDYNPKAKKTIVLAGKGITFDSGGISIKTTKTMNEMKYDMIGGAEVLALVACASQLRLPYRIVGIVAAAENLPSGKATKPGDVVKTFSGKTVEIINTDAEGRMVLSDALSYAQKKYKPDLIIDIATLTSAIIISLGNNISGAFGNNKKINNQLLVAAETTGENFHFMPLHKKYREELKSKVADLRNIGRQRNDAIFAALFLEEFIEGNTPWLHLDIAGTAWNPEGATGATVATLVKFLETVKL